MKKNNSKTPNVFEALRMRRGLCARQQALAAGLTMTAYRNAEAGLDVELGSILTLASYHGTSVHALIENNIPLALAERGTFEELQLEKLAIRKGEENLPEGMLCGLRYQRKKQHMSIQALADGSGVSTNEIGATERKGFSLYMRHSLARKLARALNCTVDELLELHDKSELQPGDRSSKRARSIRETNILDNYRVSNNLTYRALAKMLGVSHQAAFVNCRRSHVNLKYVHRLREQDGQSFAEFMDTYRSCKLSRSRSA